MLLIFGTRLHRCTVGYVAEACPCCHRPTVCQLIELSMGDHLFFVPLGRGQVPLAHEVRCLTCHMSVPADGLRYRGIGKSKKATLGELIPRTSPWLGTWSGQDQTDDARFLNILAVFRKFDASVHERRQTRKLELDLPGLLAFFQMLTVPLTLIGLVMTESMPFVARAHASWVAGILSMVSLFWGIYMIATEQRRFFRRQTLPRLLAELAAFQTGKADWDEAITRLKRLRYPNWKRLQSELARLKDAPAAQPLEIYPDAAGSVWQPPQAPLRVR